MKISLGITLHVLVLRLQNGGTTAGTTKDSGMLLQALRRMLTNVDPVTLGPCQAEVGIIIRRETKRGLVCVCVCACVKEREKETREIFSVTVLHRVTTTRKISERYVGVTITSVSRGR